MAATLKVTGFINTVTSSTKEGKTTHFARIAYSTGRKVGDEYPMQYLDVVFGKKLKDKAVELLASVKEVNGHQEHSLSKQLLDLEISSPFFHVYDGRNEGKGSYLNSEGILMAISFSEKAS